MTTVVVGVAGTVARGANSGSSPMRGFIAKAQAERNHSPIVPRKRKSRLFLSRRKIRQPSNVTFVGGTDLNINPPGVRRRAGEISDYTISLIWFHQQNVVYYASDYIVFLCRPRLYANFHGARIADEKRNLIVCLRLADTRAMIQILKCGDPIAYENRQDDCKNGANKY